MCGTIGKNDKTIGKTSPGNSGVGDQNNIPLYVFAGVLNSDTPEEYNAKLNALSITVSETQTPVYFLFTKRVENSTLLIFETWGWKLGKGVYPSVGAVSPITTMYLLETNYPQIGDLEPILTEGTVIDLGTITTDLITHINSQVLVDLSDAGTTYYLQYVLDGVTQIYEYTGVPLEYGTSTANTAIVTDFNLIYDSNNSGTFAPTPSWQQTLNVSEWGDKMILHKYTTDFGTGFNDRVFDAKFQLDGKLIACGDFTLFRENPSSKIVRINVDGSYDNTFSVGTGFNGLVRFVEIQSTGKIIVGGQFTSYNGTSCGRIIRLNDDGSIDGTFVFGSGFNDRTFGAATQADNKILITGQFTSYNGTAANRIVRLNFDGSIDGTFSTGTGFDAIARKTGIQPDNKIIVSGEFTTYNGTSANRIIRLNTDGSIDGTFAYGTGFNDFTENIRFLITGEIYLFGGFTSYNGTPANRIIRLNLDGSIDGTFNAGTGFNNIIRTVDVQSDGKLLVAGEFTSYNGVPVSKAVKLNSDGSIDQNFIQGLGFNNVIWLVIIRQTTNKMLFFGSFTNYNTYNAFRVIELNEFGDFRDKILTFNDNGDGIVKYFTDKTFDELDEKELVPKHLIPTGAEIENALNPGEIFKGASQDAILQKIAAEIGVASITDQGLLIPKIEIIKTGIDFAFNDNASYSSLNTATWSAGTTRGAKLISSGAQNFINTGKIIDNNVYSVTLTAKCISSNAAYFGFGIKNGASWGGGIWRGSNGAFSMLNYNLATFVSGGGLQTQGTYNVGDLVSVRIITIGRETYLQTAVNNVWNPNLAVAPTAMKIRHGGEIVIVVRDASTWDDMTIKVEDVNEYQAEVFVAPTGGSDSNNGTHDYPLDQITEAKHRTKGKGIITLLSGDHYDKNFTFQGGAKIRGINTGKSRLIYGTRFNSATLVVGYTKVYEVPYAPTLTSGNILWQHDTVDPSTEILIDESDPLHQGLQYRLPSCKSTWLGSLALLEATDGSRSNFFWSGGTLYFTIKNGTNLTTNPIVIPQNLSVGGSTDYAEVELSNFEVLYRGVSMSGTKWKTNEFSVLFSGAVHGLQVGNSIGGIRIKTRVAGTHYLTGTGGDGFNGTNGAPSPLTANMTTCIAFDDWSHDNRDDGDSVHNNAATISYGGLYEYNIVGAGVAAASGAHMTVHNATIRRNATGVNATGTSSDGGIYTNLKAVNCVIANNGSNVGTASGSNIIHLINCILIGSTLPAIDANNKNYGCISI